MGENLLERIQRLPLDDQVQVVHRLEEILESFERANAELERFRKDLKQ